MMGLVVDGKRIQTGFYIFKRGRVRPHGWTHRVWLACAVPQLAGFGGLLRAFRALPFHCWVSVLIPRFGGAADLKNGEEALGVFVKELLSIGGIEARLYRICPLFFNSNSEGL